MQTKLLINGKLIAGGGKVENVLDPATGKALAKVTEASREQVNAAVAAADAAFEGWARTPPKDRAALLRYLQSVLRFASLRTATPPPAPALKETLATLDARLSQGGVDHTIGRVFLEAARSDLAEHATDGKAVAAAAVANDVLPRYFAALTPARPPAPRATPRVTLTLVRWPYT